jgi:hypothetical protein
MSIVPRRLASGREGSKFDSFQEEAQTLHSTILLMPVLRPLILPCNVYLGVRVREYSDLTLNSGPTIAEVRMCTAAPLLPHTPL